MECERLSDMRWPRPKRLRFANSAKWIGLCVENQPHDVHRLFAILLHPPRQVFKGSGIKLQVSHGRP